MVVYKKILIVFFIVLFIWILFFIFKSPKKTILTEVKTNNINPTINLIPTPTILIDVPMDKLSPEVEKKADMAAKLRSSQISTDYFSIKFDYKINRFRVIFIDPTNINNQKIFTDWLKENGYDVLPLDDFIFN